jgi:succinate dehydrogenase hydrophobic anchor subunit
MRRRWQPYRGTLAWLAQRASALALVVLLPVKLYSGYGTAGKLPWLSAEDSRALHANTAIDVSLLFFLVLHVAYGLRVILIDVGIIREDRYFWRFAGLAMGIFAAAVYYLYVR